MGSDQDQDTTQQDQSQLEAFYADAKERIRFVSYQGEPWYSVVDVVGLLTDSTNPRTYWAVLKGRLQDEGAGELLTNCKQLKMLAPDGKQRLTDAANEETLLRLIQSIPSPKAEPFKRWMAGVAHAFLEERRGRLDPDQKRREYERLGYADTWIGARLKAIVVRDDLTQEWRERGLEEGREYAIITDILHEDTFDVSNAEHRKIKKIGARQDLRDSMDDVELALITLTEATARRLHTLHDSQGFEQLQGDAHQAGTVGGNARRDIEALTGQPVVNSVNYKTLRQARQRELQSPLIPDGDDDSHGKDE